MKIWNIKNIKYLATRMIKKFTHVCICYVHIEIMKYKKYKIPSNKNYYEINTCMYMLRTHRNKSWVTEWSYIQAKLR